jgi:hypothetical protein
VPVLLLVVVVLLVLVLVLVVLLPAALPSEHAHKEGHGSLCSRNARGLLQAHARNGPQRSLQNHAIPRPMRHSGNPCQRGQPPPEVKVQLRLVWHLLPRCHGGAH